MYIQLLSVVHVQLLSDECKSALLYLTKHILSELSCLIDILSQLANGQSGFKDFIDIQYVLLFQQFLWYGYWIVYIRKTFHRKLYSPQAAYAQSKLAQLMFTLTLDEHQRSCGSNVVVNGVHPGVVATELFQNVAWATSFPLLARTFLKVKVWVLCLFVLCLLERIFRFQREGGLTCVCEEWDTAPGTPHLSTIGYLVILCIMLLSYLMLWKTLLLLLHDSFSCLQLLHVPLCSSLVQGFLKLSRGP